MRALKQKGVTLWVSGAPSVALTKLLRRWDLDEVVKAGSSATMEEMLARAPEVQQLPDTNLFWVYCDNPTLHPR